MRYGDGEDFPQPAISKQITARVVLFISKKIQISRENYRKIKFYLRICQDIKQELT
jgi:hypothetical protein